MYVCVYNDTCTRALTFPHLCQFAAALNALLSDPLAKDAGGGSGEVRKGGEEEEGLFKAIGREMGERVEGM